MTELEMEALYERALVGEDAAAKELIAALTSDDETVVDFAAWSVMELIDGNVFSPEQVASTESVSWHKLNDVTRKWLADSTRRFHDRQPRPCDHCGGFEDCRCEQIDADNWRVYRRRPY